MLHIILLILKIIGIVIACIIGLILLLICSVLFVSFRYSGKLKFDKQVEYSLRGHWLLWAVSFKVEGRQANPRIIVRLFGYPLIDTGKPKKVKTSAKTEKAEKNEISVKAKNTEKAESVAEVSMTEKSKVSEQGKMPEKIEKMETSAKIKNAEKAESDAEVHMTEKSEAPEQVKIPEKMEAPEKTANILEDNTSEIKPAEKIESVGNPKKADQKPSLWTRICSIKDRIIGKIKKKLAAFKAKLQKLGNTFKKLKNKKEKLEAIFLSKEGRATIRRIKVQVFKVLKHLKFTKIRGRLHFGFDDPATTGKVLGLACILYPAYRNKLNLEPDFNEAVIDGDLYIRGRIRIFNLLLPAAKIKFDKGFNKMLKAIKQL